MRLLLKGLQPGGDYAVQVRANTGDAVSAWSPKLEFTATVNGAVPSQVQNVVVRNVGGDTFIATWDDVTTRVNGKPLKKLGHYVVRVSTDHPQYPGDTKNYRVEDNEFRFTQTMNKDVFPSKGVPRVGFEVRAVDTSDRKGDWSAPIVYAEMNKPDAPVIDECVGVMDGIDMKWHSDDPTVTKYRIYISLTPGFEPDVNMNMIWEGDATAYMYPTSTYMEQEVAITALNDLGVESDPARALATPLSPFVWDEDAPPAPTNLSIVPEVGTDGKPGVFVASWDWTSLYSTPEEDDLAGFRIRGRKANATQNQRWIDWNTANPSPPPGTVNPFPEYVYDAYHVVSKDINTTVVPLDTRIPADDIYSPYFFQIQSFDRTMNASAWTPADPGLAVNADTTPPDVPTVDARAGQTDIELTFTGHESDESMTGGRGKWKVEVSKNNTFPADDPLTAELETFRYLTGQPNISIVGLEPETKYFYRAKAIDAAGNESAWSPVNGVDGEITTTSFPLPPGPTDGFPPAAPVATGVEQGLATITAVWDQVTTNSNLDPQPETSIIQYKVHASTTSGFTPDNTNFISFAGGTKATINKVAGVEVDPDVTYYIKIVAVDADGESTPSNEISGSPRRATDDDLANVSANKITTGSLASAVITMAAGGVIQSNNYVANTSGYKLDETGLIVNNGTVSAAVLKGGVISSTTINIGAGGTLNVDSTAQIKSNNYSAGSTGWRLSSSGLEVNSGSISANLITAGTFSSGNIYVGSGGGIYDANGYWSITPSSINIYNGTIQGASVISNNIRSSNTDPSTGQYLFTINNGGYASFAGARIYGNTVVGSSASTIHYIQSYNYSGSTGWKIDGAGNAYFGFGRIYAGLFKTSNSRYAAVELGVTGSNDPTDEIRFFNGYTVSSIRNPTGNEGSIMMSTNASGAVFRFGPSGPTSYRSITMGAMLKSLGSGNGFEVRNGTDGNYDPIVASNVAAGSKLSLKKNVKAVGLSRLDRKNILKANGLTKWDWKLDPETEAETQEYNKTGYGLIADYMPDWMLVGEDAYSLPAAIGFLWDTISDLTDRIEELENRGKP